jgi:hypothetical protein
MKKATCHVSNFGHFSPVCSVDFHGYINYHDSDKYQKMSEEDLEDMAANHRIEICRNAAAIEQANRRNLQWWNKNN